MSGLSAGGGRRSEAEYVAGRRRQVRTTAGTAIFTAAGTTAGAEAGFSAAGRDQV